MKRLIYFLICFSILLLFSRCNRERTTWYPEFATPVAYGQLSFSDIESDYLQLDDDVIKVHFYDTLTPLNLADLINFEDTVVEAAYSAGFSFGPVPVDNGNTIFNLSEEFNFNLDGAELKTGKIKAGALKVIFECEVDGYLDLNYTLPGITLNENPLTLTAFSEPASIAEPYSEEIILDISGYSLDFTGEEGTERNTLLGELQVLTSDAPLYTAQVYGTDEIRVKLQLVDLEIEELRGYFGQISEQVDELITLDSVFYQGGSVSLSEVDVNLEFINNFGADAQFEITNFSGVNSISADEQILTTDGFYEQFNVPRAIETPDGVISNSFEFSFDQTSNLIDVVAITPNRFRLQADATLNPLGDISGGFDFYLDRYPFQVVTDVQFPLCVGIDNLTLADSLEVDIENVDNIKDITLFVHLDNEFPVGFEFSISLEGDEQPLLTGEVLAATELGVAIIHLQEFSLNQDQLTRLAGSEFMLVSATANTTASEEAKFLTSQKIDISITAEITYEASL